MNNNIKTIDLIGTDFWDRPFYKYIETGRIWKDITLGSDNPELYSCGNEFDGELNNPIKKELKIHFTEKTKKEIEEQPTKEEKFNYQMLGRLQMDCKYYLGNGGKCKKYLWALDENEQIEEMKKLYNSFKDDKKPEWITYEKILEYEKLMVTTTCA